jgi:hypothetical protein
MNDNSPQRPWRLPAALMSMRRHTAIVAAAAVSLLTGCGGTVHSSTTAAAAATHSGALAFARCMRAHGLTSWPDPTGSGVFDKAKLRQLGYSASRVRAIEQSSCGYLLPSGASPQETAKQTRARVAAGLAFAGCMRARGFPGFPDPTHQGELTPEMITAAGLDLHEPRLLTAALACVPVTHGLLTRAAVERAVNGG